MYPSIEAKQKHIFSGWYLDKKKKNWYIIKQLTEVASEVRSAVILQTLITSQQLMRLAAHSATLYTPLARFETNNLLMADSELCF